MSKLTSLALFGLMLVSGGRQAIAQGDPMREIQEIAEAVEEQLQEIDRLLLESGKNGQSRDKPKELLEQAKERGTTVQDGIDKLIEKLNEMKNGGGGGSGGESQSDQQQSGQQQGEQQQNQGQQGARRENETPSFVQQPQQQGQEGQQPENQNGGQQPTGGQEMPTAGQNRPGNSPPQPETAPGQPGTGEGSWGNLPPYLNFLRNRGSSPKVPEKFRKYYEAYLKDKARGKK